MKNALFRRPSGLLTIVFLVGALLSAACGSVGVAVCGDWWCVGTPIPPPCYYCRSLSSAAADLNGDGILDTIYSAEDNGMVKVRLGDAAGGVGAEQVFPRGLAAIDLMRAADVDGDTNVDVILIDSAGGQLQVLISNGTGGLPTQGPIVPIPGVSHIVDAEVGRVDGGTMDDIVLLDDAGGVIAARLWWMLDALGRTAAVLDGPPADSAPVGVVSTAGKAAAVVYAVRSRTWARGPRRCRP